MHPSKVLLHVLGWKHVNVLDPNRLEDVFLEVVVEAHTGCAFDKLAGPVTSDQSYPCRQHLLISPINVYTVLPNFARLVDERLRNSIMIIAGELIKTKWLVVVIEALVEERVTEASCEIHQHI